VADEWDPWKRYIKHQERLLWDDWYRYQYERDRMRWDPYFRYLKEIERKHWDPEYRQRLYEEKRMNDRWLEAYYENPIDPVLRQRYEMLYGRGKETGKQAFRPGAGGMTSTTSIVDAARTSAASTASSMTSSMAAAFAELTTLAYGIAEQRASLYGIVPPRRLPSMTKVIIKNALNVGLVALFIVLNFLGYTNHPIMAGILITILAMFLKSLSMAATAVALLFLSPQAITESLSWMATGLPPEQYAITVAGIYARTFLYTLLVAIVVSAVSIAWNRKKIEEMREKWMKLVSDVMEELIEKHKRESQDDAEKKKKPLTLAEFFSSLGNQPKEEAMGSRGEDEKRYDFPDLSAFFDIDDCSKR